MKDNNWFWIIGIILVVGILIYSQKEDSTLPKDFEGNLPSPINPATFPICSGHSDVCSKDTDCQLQYQCGTTYLSKGGVTCRIPECTYKHECDTDEECKTKTGFSKSICQKGDNDITRCTYHPLTINSIFSIFSSYNDRFPSEIFFEKNLKLSEQGNLVLPDGMKAENVKKIEISVTGCGGTHELEMLGETREINFKPCDYLYYTMEGVYKHLDTDGSIREIPYKYGEQTLVYEIEGLTSNQINYKFTNTETKSYYFYNNGKLNKGIDLFFNPIELKIYEKVECVSSSQCVQSAPFCDAKQHICLPKVTSCTNEYAPVCGSNGISYGNMCYSSMVGVSVVSNGLCVGDTPEEVKDDKNNTIDMSDIVVPIAQASTSNVWLYIGIIFIIILGIYYWKKN